MHRAVDGGLEKAVFPGLHEKRISSPPCGCKSRILSESLKGLFLTKSSTWSQKQSSGSARLRSSHWASPIRLLPRLGREGSRILKGLFRVVRPCTLSHFPRFWLMVEGVGQGEQQAW